MAPSRISAEEGLAILKQMAAGLAAIHAAGVVHRDIKPSNVMLDGAGADVRLWITDFGLARVFEAEATNQGKEVVAGTPGYIAPELSHGTAALAGQRSICLWRCPAPNFYRPKTDCCIGRLRVLAESEIEYVGSAFVLR